MMPTLPRPHLIVRQPRLALGPSETIFRFGAARLNTRANSASGVSNGAVAEVVVLPSAVSLPLAEHHQQDHATSDGRPRSALHQRPRDLDRQQPFLAVADIHRLPGPRRQGGAPAVHPHEGHARPAAVAGVRRVGRPQVAHRGVGRHRQQVALAAGTQLLPKTRHSSPFHRHRHPGVRQPQAALRPASPRPARAAYGSGRRPAPDLLPPLAAATPWAGTAGSQPGRVRRPTHRPGRCRPDSYRPYRAGHTIAVAPRPTLSPS